MVGVPDYKNIRIHDDAFQTLKQDKPPGVTWTHYLRELHREANDE